MNEKRQKRTTVTGYIGFFLLVAAIITAGVLIFDAVKSASGNDRPLIAGVMLAVVIVLAFLCTLIDYVRRRLTVERPVRTILEAVRRIAEGDFSVTLRPRHAYGNYDEYDTIMEHINTLAKELSKVEVFRTDFIANVSHEIKTPLAVIQNYAAALGGDLPQKTRREYAQTLAQAAKRLTALVTNILKLSKLENQQIVPRFQAVDAGERLRERLLGLEESFAQKGLELVCDIDDVRLQTDESFLEIVWNNLLSNAIKFTPAGGTVFVKLKGEGGGLALSVKDTGCGMDAETGARIFDKFYQGDTSHAAEGNGLGLALVKKVVDLLGGEIIVESEAGKGSTFCVRLCGDGA